jgi:hypothetical protein
VLLAVSLTPEAAEALRKRAVEVHVFEGPPKLRELADAALELRKQHPRLTLLVSGPDKLLAELRNHYPSLVDVPIAATDRHAILEAVDKALSL